MASLSPQLPPSSSLVLALSALQRQGEYGVVTELAEDHGVLRHAVYALRVRARAALEGEFIAPDRAPVGSFQLTVTDSRRQNRPPTSGRPGSSRESADA